MDVPDPRTLAGQILRYGTTGAAGLAVNVSLLVVLVDVLGYSPVWSPAVSTAVALSLTLVATQVWVFARHEAGDRRSLAARAPSYYLVMVVGKALNYGIYLPLYDAGVAYPVAWVIGSVVVFFGTFAANRFVWIHTAGDGGM
jgi:putative flippase GtrA